MRRLLGPHLALYSKTRGALLFGSSHQSALRQSFNAGGALISGDDASSDQAALIPVGEMELGAEYGANIGRWATFVQLGFVGQVWLGTGNAANSPALNTATTSSNNSNLGFLGLVFRWGLAF